MFENEIQDFFDSTPVADDVASAADGGIVSFQNSLFSRADGETKAEKVVLPKGGGWVPLQTFGDMFDPDDRSFPIFD